MTQVFVGDGVLETTTTTGTGTMTLGGASGGQSTFVEKFGDGAKVLYVRNNFEQGGTDREAGIGTINEGPPDTLTRDTPLESTNADALVDFPAGQSYVFCSPVAALSRHALAGGYSTTGGRPAITTAAGRGFWIDGSASPAVQYWYDGVHDIPLWQLDQTNGLATAVGLGALFTSTDAGATAGPTVELYRDSASPAANDLVGNLLLAGRSSTGVKRSYGEIGGQVDSPTNAAEAGRLLFKRSRAGALTTGMQLAASLLLSCALDGAKGAAVASTASPDIWSAGDGNLIHITGTTTITGFAAAAQAGQMRVLIFDGALQLTAGANLKLNGGGSNVTTAAGDVAIVFADTTTSFYCYVMRASGQAVMPTTPSYWLFTLGATSLGTGATKDITGLADNGAINEIEIYLDAAQQSAANAGLMVQGGTASGFETASYGGAGWVEAAGSIGFVANSNGFNFTDQASFDAAQTFTGHITWRHLGSNVWRYTAYGIYLSSTLFWGGEGIKTFAAPVTQLRFLPQTGGGNFAGGTVAVAAR